MPTLMQDIMPVPPLTIRQIACPNCLQPLPVQTDTCPACGAATALDEAALRRRTRWQWIHHRRTMLIVLLGAMGVLGIPLLWRSGSFSTREKICWSLVATIETSVLLAGCWWSLHDALMTIGRAAR